MIIRMFLILFVGYCFSDGCGTISLEKMKEIQVSLNLQFMPSAIQVMEYLSINTP